MYVVTGGAGFIGSNIVSGLAARGLGPLVVVDRLKSDERWRNIAKVELADIILPEDLFGFLEANAGSIEAVVHMGAISATTERDADLIIENNFHYPMKLWTWCAANDVRLIYASSAATYGDGSQGFDDDGSPAGLAALKPLNAYGWSKHLFDRRVARLISDDGPRPPQWVGLKFFNVYGPNEYHKERMASVVSQIYPIAIKDEPCRLFKSHHPDYADGGQLRDFIWVEDCVDIIVWLLANPAVSGLFNCGTGKARSFADLARAVYAALGKAATIEYIDTPLDIRDKYQYFTEARMQRLADAGYGKPMTSLEDGVSQYVQTYLSADDPYR
ncbi:MAG: ADP-glyceromanno-heptose 6-epimerase [Rhodospirillales bacterium]|nr:ADP-glyceromanno-heptose 6-epimerase [Rhodospirillales bacterium]